MNDDDRSTGRLVNRRDALAALAALGMGFALPGAARAQEPPACIARPEQTEGPFFVDTGLARSDIRVDTRTAVVETGAPLQLAFRVSRLDSSGCRPLPDAHVELWQCNARGVYSGVRDPRVDTRGSDFLRGYQTTDASGMARFLTIYPGWYPGRAVHLHFLIRTGRGMRREEFASQLYFDDGLSDRVLARAPYAERGARTVRNAGDFIYRRGGPQLLLAVGEEGGRFAATFDIGLQS